jgi:phosphoenolpyruvate carboxylase
VRTSESEQFDQLQLRLDYFNLLLKRVLIEYDPKLEKLYSSMVVQILKARGLQKLEQYTKIQQMIDIQPLSMITDLAKALTVFFHLANLAEELSRVQRINRLDSNSRLKGSGNTLGLAYLRLQKEFGRKHAERQLANLVFHPVLTAHPTEARRIVTTKTLKRVSDLLLLRENLVGLDLLDNERKLLAEVDLLFRTFPVAQKRPTPLQENEIVLNVFQDTLLDSSVSIYQRLEDFISYHQKTDLGLTRPQVVPFIRFGSWVGSDRDGNSSVNSKITEAVVKQNFDSVLNSYRDLLIQESDLLCLSAERSKLPSKILILYQSLQRELNIKSDPNRPFFQDLLRLLAKKVERSQDFSFRFRFHNAHELLQDLNLIQRALINVKAFRSAFGSLQHIIWRVRTFGFHLVELEIRQHSQVHRQAIKEISKRGLDLQFLSVQTRECLESFRSMLRIQSEYGSDALSRYIVSFTSSAQDIFDVLTLAKFALQEKFKLLKLDIVPLFETDCDLDQATKILDQCLANSVFEKRLAQQSRNLEVMLGYSDSSKAIGPVAATLKIHQTQANLAVWAKRRKINLTLFHGRGGALGRGGGPAHRAILAQPAGSIHNVFKITEQGESVNARYGNPSIAERHIEGVCASILLSNSKIQSQANQLATKKYRSLSDSLISVSRKVYQDLVGQGDFVEWFKAVTPLEEISVMPISSRPTKRDLSSNEFEDLRAIAWVFAWSQARINLAAWFGFGSACQQLAESTGSERELVSAYREWNFFTTLVDNIEMSVAKTDEFIAQMYMDLSAHANFGPTILTELNLTKEWLKILTASQYPLQTHPVLRAAIDIRGPYVDALSLIQVNALKKIRHLKSKNIRYQQLLTLIQCTVSGIAAGMQNTG